MNDTLENLRDVAQAHGRINVQVNDLLEVAKKAIVRAYVFIGYGLNGVNDPSIDYKIDITQQSLSELKINYILAELDADHIEDAKNEFRRWIIGNGFSEYIHIMSLFYDLLYTYLLFVEHLTTGRSFADQVRREKIFRKKMSLLDKMKLVSEEIGIEPKILSHIDGLNKMRHCLIHNAGLVSERYCNHGDTLVVRWKRTAIFTRTSSGIENLVQVDAVVEEASCVFARTVEAEKRFRKGELVTLNFHDVFEILMFAQTDLADLSRLINSYCEKMFSKAGITGSTNNAGGVDWSINVRVSERF